MNPFPLSPPPFFKELITFHAQVHKESMIPNQKASAYHNTFSIFHTSFSNINLRCEIHILLDIN